jgi:hypothetical protein
MGEVPFCHILRVNGFIQMEEHSPLRVNPSPLGKFWRALEWKILVYFMTIWYSFPIWYVWTKKNPATLPLRAN